MKKRIPLVLAMIVLALAVGPAVAYAQEEVVANIPFSFIASGKTHQPGEYQLRVSEDRMQLTLTPSKGTANVVLVMTRLSVPVPPPAADRVVFDKAGDRYYLSELWLPGEDGFLLFATKEPHTHHTLSLLRRKAK